MSRKLLATTALSLLFAGGAFAQDIVPDQPLDAAPAPMAPAEVEAPAAELVTAAETGINSDGWLATEIIGATLYTSAADDAETIGDVNDFVLDEGGSVAAVVVGVGGFLGIGQKNVAISWADLQLTNDSDGNPRLVSSVTRDQLEAAAEFNREEWLASERTSDDLFVDSTPAPITQEPGPIVDQPVPPADNEPVPAPDMPPAGNDVTPPAGQDAAPAPADPAAPAPADPAAPAPADPIPPADGADPAAPGDDLAVPPADDANPAAPAAPVGP